MVFLETFLFEYRNNTKADRKLFRKETQKSNHQLFGRNQYANGKNKKLEMERTIIEKCFGNIEVKALNAIAHSCAKLIVKESSVKNRIR